MKIKNKIKYFFLLLAIVTQFAIKAKNGPIFYDNLCSGVNDNNFSLVNSLIAKEGGLGVNSTRNKILTCLNISKKEEANSLKMAQLLLKKGAVFEDNTNNKLYQFLKSIITLREYKLFQILVPNAIKLDEKEKENLFSNLRQYANSDWAGSPATLRLDTLTGYGTKEEEDKTNKDLEKSYSYEQISQKN